MKPIPFNPHFNQNQIKSYNYHGIARSHVFKAFRHEFRKEFEGENMHHTGKLSTSNSGLRRATSPPSATRHKTPLWLALLLLKPPVIHKVAAVVGGGGRKNEKGKEKKGKKEE